MPDPVLIQDVVLVILLWLLVDRLPRWWTRRDDLDITLFRPWRGDPWPRGVQEDDDFQFDWRPARAMPRRIPDLVIDIDGSPISWVHDPDDVVGDVALARPEHVEVHRAG